MAAFQVPNPYQQQQNAYNENFLQLLGMLGNTQHSGFHGGISAGVPLGLSAAPVYHEPTSIATIQNNEALLKARYQEIAAHEEAMRVQAKHDQTSHEVAMAKLRADEERHLAIEAVNDAQRDRIRKEGAEFLLAYAFDRPLPSGWRKPDYHDLLELTPEPPRRELTVPRSNMVGQGFLAAMCLGDALSGHPLLAIAPPIVGFAWMAFQGRRLRLPG